ncbi:hypothetical protein [Thermoproteus tenax]|nr:hypothetical protein [Thermoproteus tenax]
MSDLHIHGVSRLELPEYDVLSYGPLYIFLVRFKRFLRAERFLAAT